MPNDLNVYSPEQCQDMLQAKQRLDTNARCTIMAVHRHPFRNSRKSWYGWWDQDEHGFMRFVIYSYGPHFPLAVWDAQSGIWYRNTGRYELQEEDVSEWRSGETGSMWQRQKRTYSSTTSQQQRDLDCAFRRNGITWQCVSLEAIKDMAEHGVVGHITAKFRRAA